MTTHNPIEAVFTAEECEIIREYFHDLATIVTSNWQNLPFLSGVVALGRETDDLELGTYTEEFMCLYLEQPYLVYKEACINDEPMAEYKLYKLEEEEVFFKGMEMIMNKMKEDWYGTYDVRMVRFKDNLNDLNEILNLEKERTGQTSP